MVSWVLLLLAALSSVVSGSKRVTSLINFAPRGASKTFGAEVANAVISFNQALTLQDAAEVFNSYFNEENDDDARDSAASSREDTDSEVAEEDADEADNQENANNGAQDEANNDNNTNAVGNNDQAADDEVPEAEDNVENIELDNQRLIFIAKILYLQRRIEIIKNRCGIENHPSASGFNLDFIECETEDHTLLIHGYLKQQITDMSNICIALNGRNDIEDELNDLIAAIVNMCTFIEDECMEFAVIAETASEDAASNIEGLKSEMAFQVLPYLTRLIKFNSTENDIQKLIHLLSVYEGPETGTLLKLVSEVNLEGAADKKKEIEKVLRLNAFVSYIVLASNYFLKLNSDTFEPMLKLLRIYESLPGTILPIKISDTLGHFKLLENEVNVVMKPSSSLLSKANSNVIGLPAFIKLLVSDPDVAHQLKVLDQQVKLWNFAAIKSGCSDDAEIYEHANDNVMLSISEYEESQPSFHAVLDSFYKFWLSVCMRKGIMFIASMDAIDEPTTLREALMLYCKRQHYMLRIEKLDRQIAGLMQGFLTTVRRYIHQNNISSGDDQPVVTSELDFVMSATQHLAFSKFAMN